MQGERRTPLRPGPALRALGLLFGDAQTVREHAAFAAASDAAVDLPRGDGHPVMFLPAFAMGDNALWPMARAIGRLGYAVHGWDQGRNLGLSVRVLERLFAHAQHLGDQHAKTISLIGWSAGGLYAREIARRRPSLVRRVITLATPIRPNEVGVAGAERWIRTVDRLRATFGDPAFSPSLEAPRVPTTAIHSKSDAVVPWRSALEVEGPCTENIEVAEGHLALGASVQVLHILAARLAVAPAPASDDSS